MQKKGTSLIQECQVLGSENRQIQNDINNYQNILEKMRGNMELETIKQDSNNEKIKREIEVLNSKIFSIQDQLKVLEYEPISLEEKMGDIVEFRVDYLEQINQKLEEENQKLLLGNPNHFSEQEQKQVSLPSNIGLDSRENSNFDRRTVKKPLTSSGQSYDLRGLKEARSPRTDQELYKRPYYCVLI